MRGTAVIQSIQTINLPGTVDPTADLADVFPSSKKVILQRSSTLDSKDMEAVSVALQSGLNDTQTEAKNVILLPLSSSSSAEKNIARSVGADYFVSGAIFLVEDVYGGTIVLEDFKRGDRYEIVRIAQSYALLIDELKEALQILGNVL